MSNEVNFLGILIEAASLHSYSPKEKFAHFGRLYSKYNRGGIKYNVFLDHFCSLEILIGELPTISIIENLPDDKQDQYYDYLVNEYMGMAINTFSDILSFVTGKQPSAKNANTINTLVKDLYSIIANEDIINSYVKEWEFNYNLFVKPIYDRLDELDYLPTKKEKFRHWQIEQVSKYFRSKDEVKNLEFLLEPLDTTMRNAFVHLDYFIDNNKKIITIFDRRKKKSNYTEITLHDLYMKVFRLKVNRLILLVLFSKKLSDKIGIEWK